MTKQNKQNLIIIWVFSLIITVLEMFSGNKASIITQIVLVMLGCCVGNTIIYKSALSDATKGIFITTVPALGTLLVSILQGGNVLAILCAFLALFEATLYFNGTVLLTHCTTFFVCAVAAFLKNTHYIIGDSGHSSTGIIILFTYALLSYLLYLTTRNGNRLVKESSEKSELAISQHELIKERNKQAKESTDSLKEDVNQVTIQMNSIAAESSNIDTSRMEISQLTKQFTGALEDINQKIYLTKQQNEETFALADRLKKNYEDVLSSSEIGKDQGAILTSSIDEMSSIVNDTLHSINGLLGEASTIHTIISELKSISGQTNLLALNASIEAARVGASNDGFGIVAGQIRELSEQSKEASDTMNSLLSNLVGLITTVADKVKESISVIEESILATNELMGNVEHINSATVASSSNIEQALTSMTSIRDQFVLMTDKLTMTMDMARKNESIIMTVSDSISKEANTIGFVSSNIHTIDQATVTIADFFTND